MPSQSNNTKSTYKKKNDTILWLIGLCAAIMIARKSRSEPQQLQTVDIIINE